MLFSDYNVKYLNICTNIAAAHKHILTNSSSVCRDLAWELDGCWFKSRMDHKLGRWNGLERWQFT